MADTDYPKDTAADDDTGSTIQQGQPTPPVEPSPRQQRTPRRSGLSTVVGGVIAAALGFGLAQVVPNGWPLAPSDALTTDISALKADVAALRTAVAEIPPADLTLANRLSAIEARPLPDTQSLEDRIAALELTPQIPDQGDAGGVNVATSVLAAQASAIAALQADVAAIKQGGSISPNVEALLSEAEARAAALLTQAEGEAVASLQRGALGRLETALESGAPFTTALADLGTATIPTVLVDNAGAGLPTLTTLRSTFPDVARSALDASLRASVGDSWTDRAASFLRSQANVRSLTPREGDDPDAVLSRAEAALVAGNVQGALAEIAALPEQGQGALAPWTTQATTFVAAQQAIADLRATMNVE